MVIRTHVPGPPLSDFVHVLWLCQGDPPPHGKERALPTGTVELVINLDRDVVHVYDRENPNRRRTYRGAVVSGAQSGYVVLDATEQRAIMGVHFKPGGALPFLGMPTSEVTDQHVGLADVCGAEGADLRSALLEAPTTPARFRVLERWLLNRRGPFEGHPAVAFALREFHRVPHIRTIADVTGAIGLSPRRFIDVFRQEVGLTPKLFCRIRRFQEVVRRVASAQRVEWAGVAASCGYFDQAHFIRDFKAFSGINPSAYLTHMGEHMNHVPIDPPHSAGGGDKGAGSRERGAG